MRRRFQDQSFRDVLRRRGRVPGRHSRLPRERGLQKQTGQFRVRLPDGLREELHDFRLAHGHVRGHRRVFGVQEVSVVLTEFRV